MPKAHQPNRNIDTPVPQQEQADTMSSAEQHDAKQEQLGNALADLNNRELSVLQEKLAMLKKKQEMENQNNAA